MLKYESFEKLCKRSSFSYLPSLETGGRRLHCRLSDPSQIAKLNASVSTSIDHSLDFFNHLFDPVGGNQPI